MSETRVDNPFNQYINIAGQQVGETMRKGSRLHSKTQSAGWTSCLALLIIGYLFQFSSPCSAQPRVVVSKGSLEHDFGEVSQRKDMLYKIELKNDGDRPAHLKHIQKTCGGCSPLRLGREYVKPGESAELTVRLNSGLKKGAREEKIYVQTDDPKLTSGTLTISMKWNVRAFLECQPAAIDFGRKLYATTVDLPITVDAEGLTVPVRVKEARSSSAHIRVGQPQPSGAKTVVPVSILPSAPPRKTGCGDPD